MSGKDTQQRNRWGLKFILHVTCQSVPWCWASSDWRVLFVSTVPLRPHPLRQVLNKLNKDTALVWVFQEVDPEINIAAKVFGLEDDPKKH